MKKFFVIITVFPLLTFGQKSNRIKHLENQKRKIELKIIELRDSIGKIDLEINQIESKKLLNQINDSSIITFSTKKSILKDSPELLARTIRKYDEEKRLIILNYIEGYYKVCIGKQCGFMNERFVKKNKLIENLLTSLTENKNYKSNLTNSLGSKNRIYKRGPRGGCYYINSNGKKTYVKRDKCI